MHLILLFNDKKSEGHSPLLNENLFLGVSYEVDVGKEDGEVDHRVESHQPENMKRLKDLTTSKCMSMNIDPTKEQKTPADKS